MSRLYESIKKTIESGVVGIAVAEGFLAIQVFGQKNMELAG